MNNKTLERIAKALEELIALVKEDLKPSSLHSATNELTQVQEKLVEQIDRFTY